MYDVHLKLYSAEPFNIFCVLGMLRDAQFIAITYSYAHVRVYVRVMR